MMSPLSLRSSLSVLLLALAASPSSVPGALFLRRQQPEADPDQQVQTTTLAPSPPSPPAPPSPARDATIGKEHLFEEADTDKDGFITAAESQAWYETHPTAQANTSAAEFSKGFKEHDKNGDGVVDVKEELGGWDKDETDWLLDAEREGVFKDDGITPVALAVRALLRCM